MSDSRRIYGAIKDTPDHRDYGTLRFRAPRAAPLPSRVSHLAYCGPIKDQGSLGACTGFAGSSHREFLTRHYAKYEKHLTLAESATIVFSPLYLYWREREKEGTILVDSGAQIRTCVWALTHWGSCRENTDSYIPERFALKPTPEQTAEAYNYRCGAYHRLSTVDDMKACLAYGGESEQYTFVAGFAVYSSFERPQMARDGLMPMPVSDKETFLGGHAVHVIGYDDSVRCPGTQFPGAFEVQNSWGAGWGRGGRFWMPYEFAANPQYLWDAWMSHLGEPWK